MFSNSPEGVNFKSVPAIVSGLFIWAIGNTVMVRTGLSEVPGLGLALGFVGAARGDFNGRAALQDAACGAYPLLRRKFHRHLSRLLPVHGGGAQRCCSSTMWWPISAAWRC